MAELSRTTRAEQREPAFRFLGETIYYIITNDTVNRSTGQVTSSDTVTEIANVLTSELDPKTIQNSGGQFQPGDRVFRIQIADMPEDIPKQTSEIVFPKDNGKTHIIVATLSSSDQNVWDIVGRKV